MKISQADEDFKAGDFVHHKPTGEDWILLEVKGDYVVPAGWPRCEAKASDCILIKRDDGTLCRLKKVAS